MNVEVHNVKRVIVDRFWKLDSGSHVKVLLIRTEDDDEIRLNLFADDERDLLILGDQSNATTIG